MNLIGNAIKFTIAGNITISISEITTSASFSILLFSVKDTGVGIQKQNQDKILNSFIQGEISTTKKFGRTRLGLTISNQLLGLIQSKLCLKSEPELGIEFYFTIQFKLAGASDKAVV